MSFTDGNFSFSVSPFLKISLHAPCFWQWKKVSDFQIFFGFLNNLLKFCLWMSHYPQADALSNCCTVSVTVFGNFLDFRKKKLDFLKKKNWISVKAMLGVGWTRLYFSVFDTILFEDKSTGDNNGIYLLLCNAAISIAVLLKTNVFLFLKAKNVLVKNKPIWLSTQ